MKNRGGSFARWIRHSVKHRIGVIGGCIVGSPAPLDPSVPCAPPTTVLVIRIDERVGNVLLTTPLLYALRRAMPSAQIDVLVAHSKRNLVDGLARVVPFRKKDLFLRPWRFAHAMLDLRRAHYDVAIDASHWHEFSLSSAMLLGWTAAPLRIAHRRGLAHLYASHLIESPAERGLDAEPEIRTKLRLLEPLATQTGSLQLEEGLRLETRLGERAEVSLRMNEWLRTSGLLSGRALVGLAPGARKITHRMPAKFFVALGREVQRLGATSLILWGPGEERLADEVAVAVGAGATLAPATDLEELAALLRACSLVITNDTGPMHLSVAVGTPTVALFSKSDQRRWAHSYGPHEAIAAQGRALDVVLAETLRVLTSRLRQSDRVL